MVSPQGRLRRRVHGPLFSPNSARRRPSLRTQIGPRADTVVPVTRLGDRAFSARLALPPTPPAHVRRRGRAGPRGPHAAQRDRAGQGPPRVPVRRLARHRQDVDGEDPRRLAELRERADGHAVRGVRVVPHDRQRDVARRDRDGRGVQQLGRRHPRPAGARELRPGGRPPQGLHPRRGAHAVDGGVERVPEDARGAAAAHDLRARHDRGGQGAADGRGPLPPLRLRAPQRPADRRRAAQGRHGRGDRDRRRGERAGRPLRHRLVP